MFTRPFGQRLPATTVGLNLTLKRIHDRRRVIQRFAVRMMNPQIEAQLLPTISPAESVAHDPLTLLGERCGVHSRG
jgi:hypothetical protein